MAAGSARTGDAIAIPAEMLEADRWIFSVGALNFSWWVTASDQQGLEPGQKRTFTLPQLVPCSVELVNLLPSDGTGTAEIRSKLDAAPSHPELSFDPVVIEVAAGTSSVRFDAPLGAEVSVSIRTASLRAAQVQFRVEEGERAREAELGQPPNSCELEINCGGLALASARVRSSSLVPLHIPIDGTAGGVCQMSIPTDTSSVTLTSAGGTEFVLRVIKRPLPAACVVALPQIDWVDIELVARDERGLLLQGARVALRPEAGRSLSAQELLRSPDGAIEIHVAPLSVVTTDMGGRAMVRVPAGPYQVSLPDVGFLPSFHEERPLISPPGGRVHLERSGLLEVTGARWRTLRIDIEADELSPRAWNVQANGEWQTLRFIGGTAVIRLQTQPYALRLECPATARSSKLNIPGGERDLRMTASF